MNTATVCPYISYISQLLICTIIIRVRPLSSVSQSVGVPDLSAKPPRRHSIPTKSSFSPHQASVGSITPISETRLNRPIIQEKSDTPLSDVSKSSSRCKFNVLSSVSYWLTQIKLSETACKHSVSLGFFKLALESGCEVSIRGTFMSLLLLLCG